MTYRFACFSVHSHTRELLADGREVHLSPKAFELLLVLIQHRSRVVSKTELQERLWPSTFVGETNLPTLVAEIRRGLGDSAHDSAFVRTVHRVGYRFVAEVSEAPPAAAALLDVRMYVSTGDRRFPLAEGAILIGRAPDVAIRIDAGGVSRVHARILVSRDEARVEDLGSADVQSGVAGTGDRNDEIVAFRRPPRARCRCPRNSVAILVRGVPGTSRMTATGQGTDGATYAKQFQLVLGAPANTPTGRNVSTEIVLVDQTSGASVSGSLTSGTVTSSGDTTVSASGSGPRAVWVDKAILPYTRRCSTLGPDCMVRSDCRVAGFGRVADGLGRRVRWHSRQRSLARLSEICRRPAAILLGHVTRNVLSALDLARTPAAKRFCREALALDRRLFRLWHRFRGDPAARGSPLTRAELIAKVLPIEQRLFALGERHLHAANADVRNLAYAFFVHNQHFFTFVHEDGVEPTKQFR